MTSFISRLWVNSKTHIPQGIICTTGGRNEHPVTRRAPVSLENHLVWACSLGNTSIHPNSLLSTRARMNKQESEVLCVLLCVTGSFLSNFPSCPHKGPFPIQSCYTPFSWCHLAKCYDEKTVGSFVCVLCFRAKPNCCIESQLQESLSAWSPGTSLELKSLFALSVTETLQVCTYSHLKVLRE